MEPSTSATQQPANFGARVLLGMFILWQLYFLFTSNLLELLGEARDDYKNQDEFKDIAALVDPIAPGWMKERGQVHDLMDVLKPISRRYGQVTGQTQGWSLFAPNIGNQCVFPALELRWDEDPRNAAPIARQLAILAAADALQGAALTAARSQVPIPMAPPPAELRSDNEPADLDHFFRTGNFRLRRYEGHVYVVLRKYGDETDLEMRSYWNKRIDKHLRDYGDAVYAYMRWRVQNYRKAHPDAPMPTQAILVMRRYPINDPDEAPPYREGPFIEPVARWQPHVTWQAGYGPLESYDHVGGRWEMRK